MSIDEILINECIKKFEEAVFDKEDDVFFGEPPEEFRITYMTAERKTEHYYKKIPEKIWKYSDKKLIEMPLNEGVKENKVSGMYYSIASASYWYDLERRKAFINFVMGPRFGRGYVYDIAGAGENVRIENEQIDWIS